MAPATDFHIKDIVSWGQILIGTSQENGPLASDFHVKDTTCINTLFNFYFDGLNAFHKESEEDLTIFFRKPPTKNRHYSFFSRLYCLMTVARRRT